MIFHLFGLAILNGRNNALAPEKGEQKHLFVAVVKKFVTVLFLLLVH